MLNRSIIQMQLDAIKERSVLNEHISSIMESYTITDAVFGLYEGKCGEITRGYFVPVKESDDLQECIRDIDLRSQGIRVIDNEKFILGNIFPALYECADEDHVFDIEFLCDVR